MFIVYFLFSGIAWIISLLPFPLLYLFSDILRFFLQHIFRYRRKVVYSNLNACFYETLETKAIREIAGKYYRNLADVVTEIVKTRHLTERQLLKRFRITNAEIIEELYRHNKSILAFMGHCGNWEWMPAAFHYYFRDKYMGLAVVKPLSDAFFQRYITGLRSRFLLHAELVPFKQTFRTLVNYKDELTITYIAGDQTPHKDEINYWTTFLGQETAFFLGTEKMAKALNSAVVFLDIQRNGRGHYEVTVSLISDDPVSVPDHVITRIFVHELEQAIYRHPDNWLWSHRRWKYHREHHQTVN